jgi:hypothetical protein
MPSTARLPLRPRKDTCSDATQEPLRWRPCLSRYARIPAETRAVARALLLACDSWRPIVAFFSRHLCRCLAELCYDRLQSGAPRLLIRDSGQHCLNIPLIPPYQGNMACEVMGGPEGQSAERTAPKVIRVRRDSVDRLKAMVQRLISQNLGLTISMG